MRAVQMVAPETFTVVEAPVPQPGDGQALVRMHVVGLCGSDRHVAHLRAQRGELPGAIGFTGHECIGTVERSNTPELSPGQGVLYLPPLFDGMAQYVVADPRHCVPVPAGMAPNDAVMSQQLGTVIWAGKKLPNMLDRSVAVLGQGPAGINFTALLAGMGAREVIAIDRLPRRLDVARTLGATHVVDAGAEDAVAAVRRLTGGVGPDIVVEAVGGEATTNQAFAMVRDQGTVLMFGLPDGDTMPGFRFNDAFRRQITVLMSIHAQQEPGLGSFRLAMKMLHEGRIDLRPTISHCLPLAEAQRAYDLARTGADGSVKVLVEL